MILLNKIMAHDLFKNKTINLFSVSNTLCLLFILHLKTDGCPR